MVLFDYDRASFLMARHEIDVLLPNSLINAGYLADHWKNELTSSFGAYLTGDCGTPYLLLVGLPRDRKIEPFVTCRTGGEEQDMFFNKVWIEDKYFWGPSMPSRTAKSPLAPYGHHVFSNPIEAAATALRERGFDRDGTIGVEMRFLGVEPFNRLKNLLPGARFVDALPTLTELRMIKTEEELRRMRVVAEATQEASAAALADVKEGTTGYELRDMVAINHWKAGVRFEWALISMGPSGTCICQASEVPARRGEIVRVDAGGSFKNYLSDISCTGFFGAPSSGFLKAFNAVRKAMDAVMGELKPGAICEDMYNIGKKVFEQEGFDMFLTMVAHGLGRDIHEHPFMSQGEKQALEPGMVFAIEPVLVIDGMGVVALEDEVVITSDGCESLSTKGREMHAIG